MSKPSWLDKRDGFITIDLRFVTADMQPALRYQADKTPVGGGVHVVHKHEPQEAYDIFDERGFERTTVWVSDEEVHAYFYRPEAS